MSISIEEAEAMMDAAMFPRKPTIVQFFQAPEIDPEATEQAGFDVFRNVDYIGYKVKGEKDFVSVRVERNERDPERNHPKLHAKEWAEYQSSLSHPQTDLRFAPFATPAVLETLRGLRINTVEAFAAFTDKPLPEPLAKHQAWCQRFLAWRDKPRLKLVNGEMVAA